MSNLEKWRSIGVVSRTKRVKEGKDANGNRYKAVKDDLGHVVTERGDRQDVLINAKPINVSIHQS